MSINPLLRNVNVKESINQIESDLIIIKKDLEPSKSLGRKFVRKLDAAIQKIVNFLQKNRQTDKRFSWESKQIRRFNDLEAHIKNIRKDFDHSHLDKSYLDKIHGLLTTMKGMTDLFRSHNKVSQAEVDRINKNIDHLIHEYEGSIKTAIPPRGKKISKESKSPTLNRSSSSSSISSANTSKIEKKKKAEKVKKEKLAAERDKKQNFIEAFINVRGIFDDAKLGIKIPRMKQDIETLMEVEEDTFLDEMNKLIDNVKKKYNTRIKVAETVDVNIINALNSLRQARNAFISN